MIGRRYNIGMECYGLLTSPFEPDVLLPVKIVILEKFAIGDRMTYKVKIKEILEMDLNFIKEHIPNFKVITSMKPINRTPLLKKTDVDSVNTVSELIQKLNDRYFFLEDNYMTPDRIGLEDLYNKFVKYILNYHLRMMHMVMGRSFLSKYPIYNNQKDVFMRRIERLGFGDMFQKYGFKMDI